MLSDVKNFGIKKWITALILMLFITDVVIMLDVPFLREILAFICFTTVPGILILNILKLNKLEFIKKIPLVVGLSVSFLIFAGLFLNSFYPVLLEPLSLTPVIVSFNIFLIAMALVAYKRNKDDFKWDDFLNFKVSMENKLTSMLIFPAIFPFMAVLGTYLMNTGQNNIILLAMLFLIPIYVIAVVILKDKISNSTYPFAILTIAMSLLLMHGLTSWHIMGRDVHMEYYSFSLALDGFHWDMMEYYNPYNACLSITILPVIYKTLTGFNGEYIFKLFFGLIGSIIPLVVYLLSKRYVGKQGAFFASLLLVFQTYFIYILGMVRQEIAFLFFFLAIFVFFDDKIDEIYRKVLFVILICSVAVSHYATSYIALVLIFPMLLLPFLKSLIKSIRGKISKKEISFKNFDVIVVISAFMAIWYFTVAKVQFEASSYVVGSTIDATGLGSHLKDEAVTSVLGMGIKSLPNLIAVAFNDIIFMAIAAGFVFIVLGYLKSKKQFPFKFEGEYILGVVIAILLLVSFISLPYLSVAYGAQRLFLQLLIFLAPIFVVGVLLTAKTVKVPKLGPWILLVLILCIFTSGTYLQYHLDGVQYSPYYDKDSNMYNEHFIYDQEIASAAWLKNYNMGDIGIQADGIGNSRLMLGYVTEIPNFKNSSVMYVYLGYANVNKQLIYNNVNYPVKITNFNLFVNGKNKIYDDGGSEILITFKS